MCSPLNQQLPAVLRFAVRCLLIQPTPASYNHPSQPHTRPRAHRWIFTAGLATGFSPRANQLLLAYSVATFSSRDLIFSSTQNFCFQLLSLADLGDESLGLGRQNDRLSSFVRFFLFFMAVRSNVLVCANSKKFVTGCLCFLLFNFEINEIAF